MLMQTPVYYGTTGSDETKAALWCPMQMTVECLDQDCSNKPDSEHLTRCSGKDSFQEHGEESTAASLADKLQGQRGG